jgi:membrane protease YdiL (CAAX protease family)
MSWPPTEPLPPESNSPPELDQAIAPSPVESGSAGAAELRPPPLVPDAPLFPPPVPKPRIWPALVVTTLALLASVGCAVIVFVFALIALGGFKPGQVMDVQGVIARLLEVPWGSAVLVLPGQLTMLATVIAATLLSRRKLAPRLGYTRSLLPWRAFPLLLAGTLFSGGLGGMIAEWLFPEPSPGIQFIQNMMLKPSGAGLVSLAFMVCVLPPLCEEALFRGYLQRRLLQRWHPAAAIALSSAFFVLAHFDPEHVLGVIPLGIWLGVVAWRCDSLFPAMLCHCAQNSLALLATRLAGGSYKETSPAQIVVVAIAGVLSVGAVMVMRRYPVPGRALAGSAAPPVPLANQHASP